ncbi:hypothetical protein B1218_36085, partial [Pseudomonas ogarae]
RREELRRAGKDLCGDELMWETGRRADVGGRVKRWYEEAEGVVGGGVGVCVKTGRGGGSGVVEGAKRGGGEAGVVGGDVVDLDWVMLLPVVDSGDCGGVRVSASRGLIVCGMTRAVLSTGTVARGRVAAKGVVSIAILVVAVTKAW